MDHSFKEDCTFFGNWDTLNTKIHEYLKGGNRKIIYQKTTEEGTYIWTETLFEVEDIKIFLRVNGESYDNKLNMFFIRHKDTFYYEFENCHSNMYKDIARDVYNIYVQNNESYDKNGELQYPDSD
jgi:hypothetical protein